MVSNLNYAYWESLKEKVRDNPNYIENKLVVREELEKGVGTVEGNDLLDANYIGLLDVKLFIKDRYKLTLMPREFWYHVVDNETYIFEYEIQEIFRDKAVLDKIEERLKGLDVPIQTKVREKFCMDFPHVKILGRAGAINFAIGAIDEILEKQMMVELPKYIDIPFEFFLSSLEDNLEKKKLFRSHEEILRYMRYIVGTFTPILKYEAKIEDGLDIVRVFANK